MLTYMYMYLHFSMPFSDTAPQEETDFVDLASLSRARILWIKNLTRLRAQVCGHLMYTYHLVILALGSGLETVTRTCTCDIKKNVTLFILI